MSEITPQALAELLARDAGLPAPRAIAPLAGGRNNRVFRVDLGDGSVAALKCYHSDPRDPRDRLTAEWDFLVRAWAHGVRNVPQPLARHGTRHAALYRFVAGRRARQVTRDLIVQATAFIAAINHAPLALETLAPGSEACFSLADHLALIEDRVIRLADIDAATTCALDARTFVSDRLAPAWRDIKSGIEQQAARRGVSLRGAIPRQVLSPSDFGFHNALIDAKGRATFLDFEYAGRDDPAKLICDFFCQPDVPVPLTHYQSFTDGLAAALRLDADELWRARALFDAYRIKWACIMLNEFGPIGARRRAYAEIGDRAARSARQLHAAERYLALVTSTDLGARLWPIATSSV
jgi:hypothetical protein